MPVVIPLVMVAVSAAATAVSVSESRKAARNSSDLSSATASYNAKVDDAQAQQIDLDEQQNARTMRKDNAVYLSRQTASYASAGVLESSGSPLAVKAHTAGQLEMRVQQSWVNSQQQQSQLQSQAKAGVAYGVAQGEAYRMQGTIATLNGAASIARSIGSAASESGIFSSPSTA